VTGTKLQIIVRNPIQIDVFRKSCGARRSGATARLWIRLARAAVWSILIALAPLVPAQASDVLFLTKTSSDEVRHQVLRASQLYGLSVRIVFVDALPDSTSLMKTFNESSLVAVVVSADALSSLDRVATYRALKRAGTTPIPLLIVATGSQNMSVQLSRWSDGRIEGCKPIDDQKNEWNLMFARDANMLHQLAGLSTRSALGPTCGFVLSRGPSRVLIEMMSGTEQIATFVDLSIDAQPVFAVTAMHHVREADLVSAVSLQEAFSNIAGLLIFLQYAAGDRAWRTPGHFANLTIDDPWLTEPYGNLGYEALLHEMEQHNFHTTIAFVPWNFDRSKPDVVSLFQRHLDRFSICIHGNNHNHREFGDYATHPSSRQKDDIGQALARMEQFKRLTALPYEKVMVFPHAVAPEQTVEFLKEYNYWATVNSENVPMEAIAPKDPLFPFRPWTLAYGRFPSVKRVSAEVPVSITNIAINEFLGNPQLFYVHQGYFQGGIGAFDAIADEINRLEPAVEWRSLGYVARHLYLTRVRPDHDYEILAISSNLELRNPTNRIAVFHVHRQEDPKNPPLSVMVNGASIGYKTASDDVQFDVTLAPSESGNVEISYSGGRDLASFDVSKKSLLITLDRRLSDLRDQILSRSPLGRKIQYIYYKHGFDRLEKYLERMVGLLIAMCVGYLLVRMALMLKKHNKYARKLG
jgi:peptidoglycan/xylan/chitin deacetylase (PgdA/CDA1 family)